MPITETMRALAPTPLPVLRRLRYDGGGFGLSLAQFAPEDQTRIRTIYAAVKGVYDLWLATRAAPDYARLREEVRRLDDEAFVETARALGRATAARGEAPPLLPKVVHDIRGGGLAVLVGSAALLGLGDADDETLRTCVLLARDHAKIMRNAVVDLDPARRDADEAARVHDIRDFVDKWNGAVVRVGDRKVVCTVDSAFHGGISARCLETSAIDRILYNYLSNAARFAADGRVGLTIFPVERGELVRWVTDNRLTAEEIDWLESATGGDLKRLYRGGLTRGGVGLGLTNCADFLASAFGLRTPAEAVDQGYLGARLVGDRYYAWFHWPVYELSPAA